LYSLCYWGFRLPREGMNAPTRPDIEKISKEWLYRLQFSGDGYKDGQKFETKGIVYVPNPYGSGRTSGRA